MDAREAVGLRLEAAIVVAALALLLSPRHARAQESPWQVSYPVDGAIILLMTTGSLLLRELPVDTSVRWNGELIPGDESVRGWYSASSAAKSDTFVALTVAGPMFAVVGAGVDESVAHRAVVYAEAMTASWLLNATAKYVVQRPRPYVYSKDPEVAAMAARQSGDSHLSFYSGHAAISFTAAVAGSYLYGAQSRNETARASLWSVELALASVTSSLRVRAGKHFFSDIILGAFVGSAVGFAIPRLHLDSAHEYSPTKTEYAAMTGGLVGGTVLGWLLPISDDIQVEWGQVDVVPIQMPGGAALSATGRF